MEAELSEFRYAAQIQDATYNMEALIQIRGRVQRDIDLCEESQSKLIGLCDIRMDELYKKMCNY